MPALRTELLSSGKTTTGFEIPEEFVDRLGGGRRPKARIRLQGIEFGTSIAPMGGRFLLGVSTERREASGVVAGQTYDVEIELDTEPREIAVPPDLAEALAGEPDARAFLDGLSYSQQQRLVLPIEQAKAPETRQRRVDKAVALLRERRKP